MGRAKSKTNPLEPPKKPKPTTPKPTKRLRKPTPNKPKPTAPKPTTRHRRRHGSDWGGPSDLPAGTLPTYKNIAQLYMKLSAGVNVRTLPAEVNSITQEIVDQVIKKWNDANPRIPLFKHYVIYSKVKRLIDVIRRGGNSKRAKNNEVKWSESNKDKLFNITFCQCELPLLECKDRRINCRKNPCHLKHYHCTCDLPSEQKVPPIEREFLADQRSPEPQLIIAGVHRMDPDALVEQRRQKRSGAADIARSRHQSAEQENIFIPTDVLNLNNDCNAAVEFEQNSVSKSTPAELNRVEDPETTEINGLVSHHTETLTAVKDTEAIEINEKDGFHDDIIYEPDEGEESDDNDDGWTKEKKGQNMQKLTNFVLEGIRLQIPSPALAALGNALLRDLGLITKEDKRAVIDTNKIIRWKKKVSSHLEKVRLPDVVGAKVIGIDGKKDKNSLTMVTIEGQDGDLYSKTTNHIRPPYIHHKLRLKTQRFPAPV